MIRYSTVRPVALGLAAMLLWAVAGCGGQPEKLDDAVVVPEPGTNLSTTAAPAASDGGAAPAAATTTKEATATPTAAAPAAKAEGFGTLKGQVVFDGDAAGARVLVAQGQANKDPQVCSAKPIPDERLVVDPATKGVKFALVYIPRPTAVHPEVDAAAKKAEYVFDQQGCVFTPHVLGMVKGGKLVVKSSDPVGHNVNSKVENYSSLNTAVAPGGSLPPIDLRFATRTPGAVVCDIHNWMKSWWMVSNSPYIAVTDDKGNFELKNVPAGTQKVVVWQEAVHPKFVTAGSGDEVTVQPNAETAHVFHIKPAQVNLAR